MNYSYSNPTTRPQIIGDDGAVIRIRSGKKAGSVIYMPKQETQAKPRNILNDRLNNHLVSLETAWERSHSFEQVKNLLLKIIMDEQKPLIEENMALKRMNQEQTKSILHKNPEKEVITGVVVNQPLKDEYGDLIMLSLDNKKSEREEKAPAKGSSEINLIDMNEKKESVQKEATVEEATVEPVEEATVEPVEETTAEPVEETTAEPVEETSVEPVEEAAPAQVKKEIQDSEALKDKKPKIKIRRN